MGLLCACTLLICVLHYFRDSIDVKHDTLTVHLIWVPLPFIFYLAQYTSTGSQYAMLILNAKLFVVWMSTMALVCQTFMSARLMKKTKLDTCTCFHLFMMICYRGST